MEKMISKVAKVVLYIERHLCPSFCGVVDRRRVIAYLFLTLIEVLVIPYYFTLFFLAWEPWGFSVACTHLAAFLVLQWMIWKQKIVFSRGVSGLFLLVALKVMVDSVFCTFFGELVDYVSVLSNIFVLFILAIAALSLILYRTSLVITVFVFLMVVLFAVTQPLDSFLFSLKSIVVGVSMLAFVFIYNMDKVTKGLRQPREMSRQERRALEMLANLRDMDYNKAGLLMDRLTPDLKQRIVKHAAERVRKEELENLAWDMVCADLTNSEKDICKLVLQGKTLKEICAQLDKSESNITSQRCHIRKKLNMERKDDLKRTLEMKIAEIRNAM